MGDKSRITWTDATWNPWVGCSPVSAGCANCYASRLAARFCGPGERYEGLVDFPDSKWDVHDAGIGRRVMVAEMGRQRFNGTIKIQENLIEKPIHWKRPRVIFVCSMSDPFHEKVPKEWFDRMMDVVEKAKQHTFLFLTKRPENIPEGFADGLEHVWVGVTAENQAMADKRIPTMLDRLRDDPDGAPWLKTFVSCEPLLGPIDLSAWAVELKWIIVGGESGPGFRPIQEDWVRTLRNEAEMGARPIPFHYKQNAGFRPEKLPMLDGKVWEERPDFWRDR